MRHYRAFAVDYDGTLTTRGRPEESVIEALRVARADGLVTLLVTGRILANLREDFPDVDLHFDAIVAENGAVLTRGGDAGRALASPVSRELSDALESKGVGVERGQVLVALEARHAPAAEAHIARLGLECHLSRNRAALMILPAGVSKGAGLCEALADLGISPHSTLAVGDAENDHSLLDVCELGIAVGNAVESLKSHADLVLEAANGEGVVTLLEGGIVSGAVRVQPRRWNVPLGTFAEGDPATVPGSQTNLLVAGDGGSGKSYLAGLLVERLTSLGYTVCVFDHRGEHDALEGLRGIVAVGREEPLPEPEQLRRIVLHRLRSLVVDLSSLSEEDRAGYLATAWSALRRERAATGLPHWIVVDEAERAIDAAVIDRDDLSCGGIALVTRLAERLPAELLEHVDRVVALRDTPERVAALLERFGAHGGATPAWEAGGLPGRGLLFVRAGGPARPFTLGPRVSVHAGRLHGAEHAHLPTHRRFLFRGRWGINGRSAGDLAELHGELERAGTDVIQHHVTNGDFSRWVRAAIGDERLSDMLATIERTAREAGPSLTATIETHRRALLQAIESRYR